MCPSSVPNSNTNFSGGGGDSSGSIFNPVGSGLATTDCSNSSCHDIVIPAILILATVCLCFILLFLPKIQQRRNTAYEGSGGWFATPGLTGFDVTQRRLMWGLLLLSFVSMILVLSGGLSKAWFNNLDISIFMSPFWYDNSERCYGLADKCNFCNPANSDFLTTQGKYICSGVMGASILLSIAIVSIVIGLFLVCFFMFSLVFANTPRRSVFVAIFIPHLVAMLCVLTGFAIWADRVNSQPYPGFVAGTSFGVTVTSFCLLVIFLVLSYFPFRGSLGGGDGRRTSSSVNPTYFDPRPVAVESDDSTYASRGGGREPSFMMSNPVFTKA